MRDDTVSLAQEEQHLRIPIVRAERPPVVEHDRLSLAPVLVENFGAVPALDKRHGLRSLTGLREPLAGARSATCAARTSLCEVGRCVEVAGRIQSDVGPTSRGGC